MEGVNELKTWSMNRVFLVSALALLIMITVGESISASSLAAKFKDCPLSIYEFPEPEHVEYMTSRASFFGSCIQRYGLLIAFSGVAIIEGYAEMEEVEDAFRIAAVVVFTTVIAEAVDVRLPEPEQLEFKHAEYDKVIEIDELTVAIDSRYSIYVAALSWQEPYSYYGPQVFAISLATIIESDRQRENVIYMLMEWAKDIIE
jgi:hypothetical protein